MIQSFRELYTIAKAQDESNAIIQRSRFNPVAADMVYRDVHGLATFDDERYVYRVKPLLKLIKLDKLVGSDIDCEFMNIDGVVIDIDPLIAVHVHVLDLDGDANYEAKHVISKKCRVRQNHPHAWNGQSEEPLPEGLAGTATLRNKKVVALSDVDHWYHQSHYNLVSPDHDVIQFTVSGTLEGYIYDNEGS